uniref:NADH-ubiquinone oxidoreductase chain 3 n=1 Tax=Siboglinum fiordicum TaxID=27908 RepID=A0A0E3DR17_9ANNE|nr:NADH dehydrogenase subunit 3 [Siboglinum fiordicum]AIL54872.1 NADH dehydrogenase subunit 3 [Siboglinum fiordicum]
MINSFIFFMCSIFLSLLIFFFSWFLSMRMMMSKEKFSSYECGFDPHSSSRLPFSLQFFLISILFLIFDVEIILISPLPILLKFNMNNFSLMWSNLIILILFLGLYHEWNEGSLMWLN